jgi:HSP20 family protein
MTENSKKIETGKQNTESEQRQEIEAQHKPQESQGLSPFQDMERFFENFVPRSWLNPLQREWPTWPDLKMPFEAKMPRMDVIDRADEVVVRAEVPGVEKKDLDISMTDNTVTIKGTTQHEKTVEKGDYYRSETSRGSFTRTVGLPGDVDGTNAKATFKDGILELVLPKVEKSKRRNIKIE